MDGVGLGVGVAGHRCEEAVSGNEVGGEGEVRARLELGVCWVRLVWVQLRSADPGHSGAGPLLTQPTNQCRGTAKERAAGGLGVGGGMGWGGLVSCPAICEWMREVGSARGKLEGLG